MKYLLGLLFVFCMQANAVSELKIATLLSAATATGAGTAQKFGSLLEKSFQAYGTTSAGSGASVVRVEGSQDNINWVSLGTISLTLGTTSTTDGFATESGWKYIRGYVVSISGTNASVNLLCSYIYGGI